MLKCIRDMCDRMAYEWADEQLGGNGAAVAVFAIGEKCKAGHAIQLFVSDVAMHMEHNAAPLHTATGFETPCMTDVLDDAQLPPSISRLPPR